MYFLLQCATVHYSLHYYYYVSLLSKLSIKERERKWGENVKQLLIMRYSFLKL